MVDSPPPSRARNLAEYLGLVRPGVTKRGERSRYGLYTSPQVDRDIDALSAEVGELRRRLDDDA